MLELLCYPLLVPLVLVLLDYLNVEHLPYPCRRADGNGNGGANGDGRGDGDDYAEDSSDPGMGGGLWGGSSGDFEVRCAASA